MLFDLNSRRLLYLTKTKIVFKIFFSFIYREHYKHVLFWPNVRRLTLRPVLFVALFSDFKRGSLIATEIANFTTRRHQRPASGFSVLPHRKTIQRFSRERRWPFSNERCLSHPVCAIKYFYDHHYRINYTRLSFASVVITRTVLSWKLTDHVSLQRVCFV